MVDPDYAGALQTSHPAGMGQCGVAPGDRARAPLTIAAAQSRSVPGDVEANVRRHLRFVQCAIDHEVDLIVFPELSLTGYEPTLATPLAMTPRDARLRPFDQIARTHSVTIVVGAPLSSKREKPSIGAIAFTPAGGIAYAKQHLHEGEEACFSPGDRGCVVAVKDRQVALAICADTNQAIHARDAATHGADVYAAGVLITADGYERDADILQGDAREHRMVVLMANHSHPTGGLTPAGRSAIWDETGQRLIAAVGTEEALVVGAWTTSGWTGSMVSVA